ncbi:MAG TPA: hypothetical protein ENI27_03665 [bacterium]|nr:hypothetical protein [bacterium]
MGFLTRESLGQEPTPTTPPMPTADAGPGMKWVYGFVPGAGNIWTSAPIGPETTPTIRVIPGTRTIIGLPPKPTTGLKPGMRWLYNEKMGKWVQGAKYDPGKAWWVSYWPIAAIVGLVFLFRK